MEKGIDGIMGEFLPRCGRSVHCVIEILFIAVASYQSLKKNREETVNIILLKQSDTRKTWLSLSMSANSYTDTDKRLAVS